MDLLPTFIGCPAKDLIGEDVTRALDSVAGGREIRVRFVHDPPWTTACITEKGKARLREFGIAPHWDRPSGPTPVSPSDRRARSLPVLRLPGHGAGVVLGCHAHEAAHYCRACRNPFEGFKEK